MFYCLFCSNIYIEPLLAPFVKKKKSKQLRRQTKRIFLSVWWLKNRKTEANSLTGTIMIRVDNSISFISRTYACFSTIFLSIDAAQTEKQTSTHLSSILSNSITVVSF